MKKTIAILILTCSTLFGLSQSLVVNGDATATKSVGTTNIVSETTDTTSYSQVTAQTNGSSVSLAAFAKHGGVGTYYDNSTAYVSANANSTGIINEKSDGKIIFVTDGYGTTKQCMMIVKEGISISAGGPTYGFLPTAHLHLGRGGSAAGKAPLKITTASSTLLTTPEAGAFETDGTDLYWTNNAGVRKKLTLQ